MPDPPAKGGKPCATPKAQLHQLFIQRWKGNINWSATGGQTKPGQSHFVAKAECSGARIKRDGQEVSVPDKVFEGEGRRKNDAEHAAAQNALDWLKAEGYWNPDAPEQPKEVKTRADKFRIHAERVDMNNPLVFMDLTIGGKPAGKLVIELYEHIVPEASENFRQLCTGEATSRTTGKPLTYKGACFHRAMTRFVIEGGDITNGDGSGGESIHGRVFDDEQAGLAIKHTKPFMVAMSNMGSEHTNSSTFFITTSPCTHLNGEHVVCGQVVRGFGAVRQVENTPTDPITNRPLESCIIADCGQLPRDFNLDTVQPLMEGQWPRWAEDLWPPKDESNEALFRLRVAQSIKESANEAFKAGDMTTALVRYEQAINMLNWITFRVMEDLVYDDSLSLYKEEYLLRLNRAAALLRLHEYREAVLECKMVLHRQPENIKALYRLGQAYLGVHELNNAVEALMQAARLEPTNAAVRAELTRTRGLMAARKQREKLAFQHFFSSGNVGYPDVELPSDDDEDLWQVQQEQQVQQGYDEDDHKQCAAEDGHQHQMQDGSDGSGQMPRDASLCNDGGRGAGNVDGACGTSSATASGSQQGAGAPRPAMEDGQELTPAENMAALLAMAANPRKAGMPRDQGLYAMAAEMRERLSGWVDFGSA